MLGISSICVAHEGRGWGGVLSFLFGKNPNCRSQTLLQGCMHASEDSTIRTWKALCELCLSLRLGLHQTD